MARGGGGGGGGGSMKEFVDRLRSLWRLCSLTNFSERGPGLNLNSGIWGIKGLGVGVAKLGLAWLSLEDKTWGSEQGMI